jgi:predicted Zn-dependent peptidase
MAHAQEHMAFRGCTGMSADQTAAIYAELGGQNNADTQQNITQYFATVPAADLEVALEAQAACLRASRTRTANGRRSAAPSSRRSRATCRIRPTSSSIA